MVKVRYYSLSIWLNWKKSDVSGESWKSVHIVTFPKCLVFLYRCEFFLSTGKSICNSRLNNPWIIHGPWLDRYNSRQVPKKQTQRRSDYPLYYFYICLIILRIKVSIWRHCLRFSYVTIFYSSEESVSLITEDSFTSLDYLPLIRSVGCGWGFTLPEM